MKNYLTRALTAILLSILMPGTQAAGISNPTFTQPYAGAVKRSQVDRINEQALSIKDFGAVGDWNGTSGTDNTVAVANAIASGRALYVPAGRYMVSKIVLRYELSMVGEGQKRSSFESKPNSGEANFVTLPIGPVGYVKLQGLGFYGAGTSNPAQSGWYFEAKPSLQTPFHGGLWNSVFKDCDIYGFDGHQIVLRGGASAFQLPHQFLSFENILSYRANDGAANRTLLMTGQVQHVTLKDTTLDGHAPGLGTNIEISREFSNAGVYGGATSGGAAQGDNAPSAVTFTGITSQSALLAIFIDRAGSTTFEGSYFEAVTNVANVVTSSNSTLFLNNFYTNVSPTGSAGVMFKTVGSAALMVKGGKVVGAVNKVAVDDPSSLGMIIEGLDLTEAAGGGKSDLLSSGVTKQISVETDGSIILPAYKRTAIVNGSTTRITQINALLMPGESLYFKAHNGSLTFATGGNLTLGRSATFTLAKDEVAHFIRMDLGGLWLLVH